MRMRITDGMKRNTTVRVERERGQKDKTEDESKKRGYEAKRRRAKPRQRTTKLDKHERIMEE